MMSKWILKAIVQKGISYLPAPAKINYFFQKHVTGGVILNDEHFGLKMGHALDHHAYMKKALGSREDITILELGTGWYPVIPMLFFLSSSCRVISADIQQWMTRKTQQDTILKFKEWKDSGKLKGFEEAILPERWDRLMHVLQAPEDYSQEDINRLIGLTPLITDARKLPLKKQSVDFICSNNTFEHIPLEVLTGILQEFKRVQDPDGLMSHFIDMSDHFAHFDPAITIYNFLKYSKKKWGLVDNSIQPQNRLRFRDFLELYQELGLPVKHQEIREGSLQDLEKVKVHPEFSGYSPEELAISHAYIIS